MDQLPRLGKRELICLLLFTCNYVVFVWRGFLFLWVLGMGYVILLWHSLSLPYNSFWEDDFLNILFGNLTLMSHRQPIELSDDKYDNRIIENHSLNTSLKIFSNIPNICGNYKLPQQPEFLLDKEIIIKSPTCRYLPSKNVLLSDLWYYFL